MSVLMGNESEKANPAKYIFFIVFSDLHRFYKKMPISNKGLGKRPFGLFESLQWASLDVTCVTRFFGILLTLYMLVNFVFFLITEDFFHNTFYFLDVLAFLSFLC